MKKAQLAALTVKFESNKSAVYGISHQAGHKELFQNSLLRDLLVTLLWKPDLQRAVTLQMLER